MRNARQLREAKGWSLRYVAARVGCDHTSIAKFEDGGSMLREPSLLAYARLLKVKVDDLIRVIPQLDEVAAE